MCYKFRQMGHYAIDYLELVKTCSYFKGQNHNVEQCPQLIKKWQARTITGHNPVENENPNPNMNVHIISVEPHDLNVVLVTRGGAATGVDQDKAQEQLQP